MRVANIKQIVSEHFNLRSEEFSKHTRKREIVRARQIAMFVAYKNTCHSLAAIARMFGFHDHTTVWHAIKQVENLKKKNKEFQQDILAILKKLEDYK